MSYDIYGRPRKFTYICEICLNRISYGRLRLHLNEIHDMNFVTGVKTGHKAVLHYYERIRNV